MVATPSTAAAVLATPTWVTDLEEGMDMLQNFNFSQIGDAITTSIGQFKTNPVGSIETIANTALQVATVAGVPYAGTAEALLPTVENMITFAMSLKNLFGTKAAATATAISSPPTLAPMKPVTVGK